MVTVMRDGEEVKLSKRAGSYVTLRDLIDEVGRDATRFFLAARSASSQLTFDINLALSQSNDNPVYYIQYAHAGPAASSANWPSRVGNGTPPAALPHLAALAEEQEKPCCGNWTGTRKSWRRRRPPANLTASPLTCASWRATFTPVITPTRYWWMNLPCAMPVSPCARRCAR